MDSIVIRQTLKTVVILAAAAASFSAFSQPAFDLASTDSQRQAVERIQEIQSRDGPNSADLIEPLTVLGLLYAEDEDHFLAGAVFERARGIVRVNYGLFSLEEAPLLRQSVRTEEARGNVQAAWDLEQELLTLVRRHPKDLRTVPILREIVDKRMEILERYRVGQFPVQIVLGCYYRTRRNPSCHHGSRGRVIRAISSQAQWYRAMAIEVLLRNERYASNELRELEMESLRAGGGGVYVCPQMRFKELLEMELIGSCLEPVLSRDDTAFAQLDGPAVSRSRRLGVPIVTAGGPASLIRLLIYDIRSRASQLSQANAFVRLADYLLAFSRGSYVDESVLGLYERVYRQLERSGVAQASIEEIFSPKMPVVVPTHRTNPLVSMETPESTGHIDVAFHITKYGESEHTEILDTANATRAAQKDLVHLIERSRFRPRLTDGGLADTSRVVVRYYLSEQNDPSIP